MLVIIKQNLQNFSTSNTIYIFFLQEFLSLSFFLSFNSLRHCSLVKGPHRSPPKPNNYFPLIKDLQASHVLAGLALLSSQHHTLSGD